MNKNFIYIYIYIPYQGSKYGFFGYKLFAVKVGIHDVCDNISSKTEHQLQSKEEDDQARIDLTHTCASLN